MVDVHVCGMNFVGGDFLSKTIDAVIGVARERKSRNKRPLKLKQMVNKVCEKTSQKDKRMVSAICTVILEQRSDDLHRSGVQFVCDRFIAS